MRQMKTFISMASTKFIVAALICVGLGVAVFTQTAMIMGIGPPLLSWDGCRYFLMGVVAELFFAATWAILLSQVSDVWLLVGTALSVVVAILELVFIVYELVTVIPFPITLSNCCDYAWCKTAASTGPICPPRAEYLALLIVHALTGLMAWQLRGIFDNFEKVKARMPDADEMPSSSSLRRIRAWVPKALGGHRSEYTQLDSPPPVASDDV